MRPKDSNYDNDNHHRSYTSCGQQSYWSQMAWFKPQFCHLPAVWPWAGYLTSGTYSRHCQFLRPIPSHPLNIPTLSSPTFHAQHLHLCWRAILGLPESTLSMRIAGPESPGDSLWPMIDICEVINAPASLPLAQDSSQASVLYCLPEFPAGLSAVHPP